MSGSIPRGCPLVRISHLMTDPDPCRDAASSSAGHSSPTSGHSRIVHGPVLGAAVDRRPYGFGPQALTANQRAGMHDFLQRLGVLR
jgi:hypothetical protein